MPILLKILWIWSWRSKPLAPASGNGTQPLCVDDRRRTRDALLQVLKDGQPRLIECRLGAGTDRWLAIDGLPCASIGARMRMLGTARDISMRKSAEAQRELAGCELEHRLQNFFAILTSVVSLSARSARTTQELASSLQARIGALARAHSMLRDARAGVHAELRQVIEGELVPFTGLSNVSIEGPVVHLDDKRAVALISIFHELTTNALKHGALSHAGGHVTIDWTIETSMRTDCLVLRWKEDCSAPAAGPRHAGSGLTVLRAIARDSLRGDILLDFESAGLTATLVAPLSPPISAGLA